MVFFLHSRCRCFFFLIILLNVAAASSRSSRPPSFRFNFSDPSSYDINDLTFEGRAVLNQDLVDLTCNSQDTTGNLNCLGRMSYNHSVPFYDSNTGHVASFSTRFTFIIRSSGANRGDGMAFFLANYPSKLPPKSSGGNLGLTNSGDITTYGEDRFVAVEFDTYSNKLWDPSSDHIGIDVNSIKSVSTTSLPTNSLNGTMTATITFDGRTRMLEASLHFDSNSSIALAQVRTQLPEPLSDVLPPEVAVGFSAATGADIELHQILSWSFNSTLAPKGRDNRRATLIIVVCGLVAVVVAWLVVSWCRWRITLDSFRKGTRLKRFHYRELAAATDNFSPEKKIGHGGFGDVYKGNIEQLPVAVKQLIDGSIRVEHKTMDFLAELKAIGGTGHKNLARLEGWCCSINTYWGLLDFMCFGSRWRKNIKLFVVYELLPNGDLNNHLQENSDALLPWIKRYKIVKDIGFALCYLHNECGSCILHRDIKPSNIFLDNDFNAKLGDFGLSRVMEANATSHVSALAVGTFDYMDPLCRKNGSVKFRRSSDIYSFGIVLLEIAHGENNRDLVWQKHATEPADTFTESAADKRLNGQFDPTQMKRVIVLGLRCSDPDELQRPSMISAMKFLEQGGELRPATDEERHGAGTAAVRDTSRSYLVENRGPESMTVEMQFMENGGGELRPAATTHGDERHGSPISDEHAFMPYGTARSSSCV